jgi:AraC-like DNA-binding protein
MMSKVPSIHFDSNDLPPDRRFDHWRAAIPTYDVTHAPGAEPDSFRAVADVWLLGDFTVSTRQTTAMRYFRSAEQAGIDGCDQFIIFMVRKGGWAGQLGERTLTAGPGQVVMFDLTRPFDTVGTAGDSIALRIARAPIVAAAPDIDLHGFVFQGQTGRILADHFMMLVRRLPHTEIAEAAAIVNATCALIGSCIAAAPERDADTASRDLEIRHRVFRYIDDHLGTPELTTARICKEVGISRSVLYRAFAPLGGIADYLRARRLEAAHAQLEDPAVGRQIADIAGEFGFISDAHFSRSFRKRYGYNPRRARNGHANGWHDLATVVDAYAGPEIFRAWLQQVG